VHLRISERLWERARDAERLLVDLQTYLNKHEEWLWWQPSRYRGPDGIWCVGAARPVMRSLEKDADLKVVLRPGKGDGVDYTVVALRRSNQLEQYEAVGGRSLKGTVFKLLRPWESAMDTVVIISPKYLRLPQYLKTPIVMAWNRLVSNMTQRKVVMGEDTIFLLTGTPNQKWMTVLNDALIEAQVGRVTVDPYETKRAADLIEKYGQECGH